ncbi:hypothetical protein HYY71_04090 [Candidatus Woesearchaeota archaeon]|nr:hypothetical protein [Candidatus Woesearchaeota archaeon]
MARKFIIEHSEPELYKWCFIEYEHISKIVGKGNLIFSSIKKKDKNKLEKYGMVCGKSVSDLNLKNICVLSQYSKKTLKTNDRNNFQYFVFGGILGDNPAKKRTGQLIYKLKKSKIKFETRNIGKKQMPTDVAVYAAKKILEGKKLSDFKFADELEIEVNQNESVVLPFRYAVDGNKLVISEKLVDYLRERKGF